MNASLGEQLFVLPCDHRDILRGLWDTNTPTGFTDGDQWVTYAKHLILDGLLEAVNRGIARNEVALLMDEELGAPVLERARDNGILRFMPVDDGTVGDYTIQYGTDMPAHVTAVDPDFVQTLINYNPVAANASDQMARIKPLLDWLSENPRPFMLELQVLPTNEQLAAGKDHFVAAERPGLILRAIDELQQAGANPELWKLEQMGSPEAYEQSMQQMRAAGRDDVKAVVLGGGADTETVDGWLRMSAGTDGYVGFAVGRSCWARGIENRSSGTWTAAQAVTDIADTFEHFATVFTGAKR
ncbi:2-deoxy-5-keto-D-gluconate 6-phosphate aldolase domain-containing protein [Cucumibacter marinus]|uniref:2-deoxy-5-keto-D-gluconate 6-phosphate aldolase domain-containing protein n=1 Tax=Cucumibacter marinus TaxID=1121252 RepID=UPI00048CD1B1|nr:DUF2090 domain-containing protein [Cucumibacter marinus]